jgi:WD40 repeat protein
VETIEGDVKEEHTVPYVQIYHEILSTHEVITQTLQRDVSFQAVDLRDGRVLLHGDTPLPHDPSGIVAVPRFATNGDRSVVAVGFGPPRSNEPVTFYDTRTWRPLGTLALPPPGPSRFWSMGLSNDGTRLAYNAEDAVMVVDVASGSVLGRFPMRSADTFAFSPDGSMLAVAERGSAEGHASKRWIAVALHVFRLSDGVEVARREQPRDGSVRSIAWDPRGRFLAFLDGETVHLWKPPAREATDVTIRLKSEIVGGMAISPDGKHLAVGDGYAIDVFRIGGDGKTTHR